MMPMLLQSPVLSVTSFNMFDVSHIYLPLPYRQQSRPASRFVIFARFMPAPSATQDTDNTR
jgi:hypothetical protein